MSGYAGVVTGTPREQRSNSKVKIRSLLGRLFSSPSSGDEPSSSSSTTTFHDGPPPASAVNGQINEISSPFNTVHRIHVGYDGSKFSGLPQSWLEILHREISEADQKKNPKAVVTALKFYASAIKEQEREEMKFMVPMKSVYPSDDDIDVDLSELGSGKGSGRRGKQKGSSTGAVESSSTLDSVRTTSSSEPSSMDDPLLHHGEKAGANDRDQPFGHLSIGEEAAEEGESTAVLPEAEPTHHKASAPPAVPPRHAATVCTSASSPTLSTTASTTATAQELLPTVPNVILPVPAVRTLTKKDSNTARNTEQAPPQSTVLQINGADAKAEPLEQELEEPATPVKPPPPLPPKPTAARSPRKMSSNGRMDDGRGDPPAGSSHQPTLYRSKVI